MKILPFFIYICIKLKNMLVTKLGITVAQDYQSVSCYDLTGFGITGYSNSQDPAGLRGSNEPLFGKIIFTSPDGNDYDGVLFNDGDVMRAFAINKNIAVNVNSTALGELTVSNPIEDGLWKANYLVFFKNGNSGIPITMTTTVFNGASYYYNPGAVTQSDFLYFNNVKYIYLGTTTPILPTKLYTVDAPIVSNSARIYLKEPVQTVDLGQKTANQYRVGYSAIKYFVVARQIKNCLDEKVAALPNSNCPCKEKQVNKLMSMYMLYDAMFINAENGNSTKAQYLFDILTNYCSDSDCKCND